MTIVAPKTSGVNAQIPDQIYLFRWCQTDIVYVER